MDSILETKQKVVELKKHVLDGRVFQSLGEEFKKIIENEKINSSLDISIENNPESIDFIEQIATQLVDERETFQISDSDLKQVVDLLSSTDPEIRDHGAYFFLVDAIQSHILTDKQVTWLANYLIEDKQLFFHIDEKNNDGIFRRSFSILVLAQLLREQRRLNQTVVGFSIDQLVDQFVNYVVLERDTRGFIGKKGWAHTFTHIADVFEEIIYMDEVPRAIKIFVFSSILERYSQLTTPLVAGETQRIVVAVSTLINKHRVYEDYFMRVLASWRQEMINGAQPQTEEDWHKIFNRNRFLQGLLLRKKDLPKEVADYVEMARDFLS